jgi:uncharacterized protein DUF6714
MSAAEVRQKIERAFGDVPRPSDDRICGTYGDEARDDTEPYKGRDWRDLERDLLGYYHYALTWFTPEAFHYYLPAFLVAGLEDPDAIYVVSVLQMLRPNEDPSLDPFSRDRWQLLNDEQIAAVQLWLEWLLARSRPESYFAGEVREALTTLRGRYWWV